jgi:hypothetical protein
VSQSTNVAGFPPVNSAASTCCTCAALSDGYWCASTNTCYRTAASPTSFSFCPNTGTIGAPSSCPGSCISGTISGTQTRTPAGGGVGQTCSTLRTTSVTVPTPAPSPGISCYGLSSTLTANNQFQVTTTTGNAYCAVTYASCTATYSSMVANNNGNFNLGLLFYPGSSSVNFGCGSSSSISTGTTMYIPVGFPAGYIDANGNVSPSAFSQYTSSQISSINSAGYKVFFCNTDYCNSVSSDFTSSSAVSAACTSSGGIAALSGGAIGGIIAGVVILFIVLPLVICALCCGGIGVACARLAGAGKAPPMAAASTSVTIVGAPSQPQFNPLQQSMPPPLSTWRAHSNGADKWVNTATNEVSWVLPPGAVVVA